MPDIVQQPTPQPQVTTSQGTNWKKIGLTVLIILVVTGLIGGAYWYYVSNKSSDDSDLTGPVPKVTTPTATESAKEATPSAEKDKTADWKTYTDSRLKFQVKHPSTWVSTFEDTGNVTLKKGSQSIIILEGGALGFGGELVIRTESLAVGNKKLDFYYYSYGDGQNAYMNKVNLDIPGSSAVLGFWIILDQKTSSEDLAEVKKILSTFEFIE